MLCKSLQLHVTVLQSAEATLQFHNSPLSSQIESRSAEIGAICNIVLKMGFSPDKRDNKQTEAPNIMVEA